MPSTRLLLRRAVLAACTALGTSALALCLHGMTTIDAQLRTAATTSKPPATTANDTGHYYSDWDCPDKRKRERT